LEATRPEAHRLPVHPCATPGGDLVEDPGDPRAQLGRQVFARERLGKSGFGTGEERREDESSDTDGERYTSSSWHGHPPWGDPEAVAAWQ
jgi:hypothetical protein